MDQKYPKLLNKQELEAKREELLLQVADIESDLRQSDEHNYLRRGSKAYIQVTITELVGRHGYNVVPIWEVPAKGRGFSCMEGDLIPHGDLMPTAEHEQAIKEAKTQKIRVVKPVEPMEVLEYAEGMAAYVHGSAGFKAYRDKLCDLLTLDRNTEIDSMKLRPVPIEPAAPEVHPNCAKQFRELLREHERAIARNFQGSTAISATRQALFAFVKAHCGRPAPAAETVEPNDWARPWCTDDSERAVIFQYYGRDTEYVLSREKALAFAESLKKAVRDWEASHVQN